ncbi:MAG: GIY-YIG nuclease family protein [Bacteroidetes bacterium]|nr:GIY-YIG nuclease family protein [Bacteroidota bacterium]
MKYYVYILQSIPNPENNYVGITTDLQKRIVKHNEGGSPHTAKYKPWQLKISICFNNKHKAHSFEKYLKSHSGSCFHKKTFLNIKTSYNIPLKS